MPSHLQISQLSCTIFCPPARLHPSPPLPSSTFYLFLYYVSHHYPLRPADITHCCIPRTSSMAKTFFASTPTTRRHRRRQQKLKARLRQTERFESRVPEWTGEIREMRNGSRCVDSDNLTRGSIEREGHIFPSARRDTVQGQSHLSE